jgi:hypothetical protein
MLERYKKSEMMERVAEISRMSDILLPLQDGDRVATNLANVGFGVECFFDPASFRL